uniref:Membrane-associated protein n=1 Tax=Macrostomum lignano TaxID=282301 RepID=A0A1I8IPD7_9PLAT
MRILCRVTSLLLAVLALCSGSSDATEPCTANCASLSCSGFSQRTMTCSNGTVYDIGYCYNPGAFVCPSAQFDGSLILTITGISPNQLLPYYALLQRAVKWAYNSFCLAGDNYKFCCPGARGWSKPNSGLSNYVAIASEASEVLVLAVRGDIGYSVVALSISPSRHSVLCNAVTYDTTAAAETTPIVTTTIATVTSGDSSSSPSDSSSSAPSVRSSTAAPSGSSTAAPSGSSTSLLLQARLPLLRPVLRPLLLQARLPLLRPVLRPPLLQARLPLLR